jgi:anaphase-promoting complex subunit 2
LCAQKDQAPLLQEIEPKGKSRQVDVVAQLVAIFGSRDMFVREYKHLLSSRLLALTDYAVHEEKANLERLKLRFGVTCLQECEVMLRDVVHSKRINAHVTGVLQREGVPTVESGGALVPNATILSHLYWPTVRAEKVQLPSEVTAALDAYAKEYTSHKGARSLEWVTGLGMADIAITLPGEEQPLRLQVTPAQLAVVWHFRGDSGRRRGS